MLAKQPTYCTMDKKFLQRGHVFEIKNGHKIQISLPQKYVYSNVSPSHRDAEKLTNTTIEVGKKQSRSKGAHSFDTSIFVGEYVVINTAHGGGGTGHGPHDVYPDGHGVTAKKLKQDGSWDDNGLEIFFYQSGCFTCQINEEIPIIRTMNPAYVWARASGTVCH